MKGRSDLPLIIRRFLASLGRVGIDLRPVLSRTRNAILRPARDELVAANAAWQDALRDETNAQRLEIRDQLSSSQETLRADIRALETRIQDEMDERQTLLSALRANAAQCRTSSETLRSDVSGQVARMEAAHIRGTALFDARTAELVARLETERRERRSQVETLESLITESHTSSQAVLDQSNDDFATPIVSVILPTRNRARIIPAAIASVHSQRFARWELIVVDDGSCDNTAATVAPYLADTRVRYVTQAPSGVSRARNHGLKLARGPLIAYLDSDNVWYPDFLAAAVNAFAVDPALTVVYGVLVTDAHILEGTHLLWMPFDRERLLQSNFIDMNVVVHRKSLRDRYGGFDEQLERLSDWDLLLRYTEHTPARPLPVLAARYRVCDSIRISDTRPVGPSHVAVKKKWYRVGNPKGQPRVLYALRRHPALSDAYVETEIRCMLRWGVRVDVWLQTSPASPLPSSAPIHEDSLADAVRRVQPDVIHVHGLGFAAKLTDLLDESRVPVTIRADGLEMRLEGLLCLLDRERTRRIYLFPHQRQVFERTDPRLSALPVAFDTTLFRQPAKKDRRLVLAAGRALPRRDIRLFFELAKRLPDHQCVFAAERCSGGPGYGEGLRSISRAMDSPAQVMVDLERADLLPLVADAGIYLDTARPPRTRQDVPVGTLSAIAESMATGSHILVPDISELREFPGKAGSVYHDVAHAAKLITATASWSEGAWLDAESASVDRAFLTHSDELALRPLFEDWCAMVPAGRQP